MATPSLSSKSSPSALLLSFGIQFLFAWTAPTAVAPGGNVDGPLTVGAANQIKTGGLSLGSLIVDGGASIGTAVGLDNLCLNGSCITSWPTGAAGSGSTILDISAASVLTAPGGVITNFTSETIDTLNVFTPPNTVVSLPAGTYLVEISAYGCGFLSNNGTGPDQVEVQLHKNGVEVLSSDTLVSGPGYNCLQPKATGIVTVAAGEKLTLNVWHDEVATNVNSSMKVTSFGGGGGGATWQDVPLSDSSDFDISCEYKLTYNGVTSYPSFVAKKYILNDASTKQFAFSRIDSNNKSTSYYTEDGDVDDIDGNRCTTIVCGSWSIDKIEKRCD